MLACSQAVSKTSAPILTANTATQEEDAYFDARQQLVDEIKASGVEDPEILQIMASVPRHEFVPANTWTRHMMTTPPIGYGQTISQPYIVAWMTELLGVTTW
jgi:protein-L-isoaspartate(D-aspartate) O-methyltransferase